MPPMPETFASRIPAPRATFSYQNLGRIIAVTNHDQGRSVTNDADTVIARLAENSTRAASGDELLVRDGRSARVRQPQRLETFAQSAALRFTTVIGPMWSVQS
jgi:hypothetical protein